MPRFRAWTHRWLITIAMLCIVVAWPLHEARHASEPVLATAALAVATATITTGTGTGTGTAAATPDASTGPDVATMSGTPRASDDDDADNPNDGSVQIAKPCVWCMFHGAHHADLGAPPSLTFHAEASPPPVAAPCGRPTGRCPLAAEPRGPPLA